MHKPGEIRILALGLIRDGDRIFISEGYDPGKQQTFYRVLGGGVDFGETSRDALQREFQEEIQAELTLDDGQVVMAHLTRDRFDQLQLEPQQKVYVKPKDAKSFPLYYSI